MAHESRDLSQSEMKILLLKAEQIHKITTIFNQNDTEWKIGGSSVLVGNHNFQSK